MNEGKIEIKASARFLDCDICHTQLDQQQERHLFIVDPQVHEISAVHWECMLEKVSDTALRTMERT